MPTLRYTTKLKSVLKRTATNATRRAEVIVAKAARDIEGGAKNRCPVDTGNLKNSIQSRQTGPAAWEVRVGAEYGIYVHDGTRVMRPRPFLVQAVDAERAAFEAAVAQLIRGS